MVRRISKDIAPPTLRESELLKIPPGRNKIELVQTCGDGTFEDGERDFYLSEAIVAIEMRLAQDS